MLNFFVLCAIGVPILLLIWWLYSWMSQLLRTLEHIAQTLGRIEAQGRR